ncbi:MAG: YihY/virulence factor BrkB family protein [Chloroflexi bacterium]|nr:YihY/virulence factor BrkB family protein [Chloroflexota bacterium]
MAKAKESQSGAEVAPPRSVFQVAKQTVIEFMDDNCLNLAAAIAYYALQSIIPLILGFVVIGSFFLQDPLTRKDFIQTVVDAVPKEVGQSINFNELIEGLITGAGAAGIASLLALLWTGSGIFDQLIFAINKAYDVEKDKRNFFFKLFLRVVLLLGIGLVLAASFTITIIFNLIFTADISLFGISPKNFSFMLPLIFTYLIPLSLETIIFTILYRVSPARKGLRWRPILIGALVAALLFELLKVGFTYYITSFGAANSAAKTYGAIGGIIVFLFFIYLSAAVVLFGAELSAVLHHFKTPAEDKKAVVEAKSNVKPSPAATVLSASSFSPPTTSDSPTDSPNHE